MFDERSRKRRERSREMEEVKVSLLRSFGADLTPMTLQQNLREQVAQVSSDQFFFRLHHCFSSLSEVYIVKSKTENRLPQWQRQVVQNRQEQQEAGTQLLVSSIQTPTQERRVKMARMEEPQIHTEMQLHAPTVTIA